MAAREDPKIRRGETYYSGVVPNLPNTATPDIISHSELEGTTWEFPDLDYSVAGSVKPFRSGRSVKVMLVRNLSGGAILPKQLAKMKTDGTGNEFMGQVMSNNPAVGDLCFPTDEFLPAAGVVANDLFYVVVAGTAKVTTDTAGDTNISIGSYVVPGAGTAGRVVDQNVGVAAGAATFAQINGCVGRAITAVNAISTDFLIDVGWPKVN